MSEQKKLLSELTTLEPTDVQDALISGLRARPNATSIYGAKGLTADELKKQYDKYPEKLRVKLNELVKTIKDSLDNSDENGSQIAEEIMVVVGGFSTDERTDNLANAVKVMIERILGSEESAEFAKASAESAIDIASGASTVAKSAIEIAHGAESVADNALQTANESKEIANDAYSYARTAEQDSAQAKSLAESATSFANDAYKSAEDAIKIADEAISIANRASEGIGFKTRAEMYAYINSMSWFKDYHFDRHAIIPKGSYVVVSIDFETKEYVNS
jgi:methyl-accepting chemotaxis protein